MLLLFGSAGLAQQSAYRSPLDNSPVEWFTDDWPIPSVAGTDIRVLRFYDNLVDENGAAGLAASRRKFVLRRAEEAAVEMEYDSAGHLIHAVLYKLPINFRDTLEVHREQTFDENGRLVRRIDRRIDLGRMTTILRDTTFYTYDKKGRPQSLRIPRRPWRWGNGEPVLGATDKLTEYVYNRKGRLTKLVKRCDPSSGPPSGMLVVCAQDSFLYDPDGRIAEIQTKALSGWETARHFLYNARGLLKETAVYAGRNPYIYIQWQYDAANRAVECVQESASGFEPPRIMTFDYDDQSVLRRFRVRKGADQLEGDWVIEVE